MRLEQVYQVHICMYVSMYVCIYVCMYKEYVRVPVWLYIKFINVCMSVCVYVCMYSADV